MVKNRFLTRYTFLLIFAGILINFFGAKFALFFKLPLFFDSIGTILSAALGGYFPGITVGFFSNVINGVSDPITLYYSIISIFIAAAASFLSRRGTLTTLPKCLASSFVFSFIGGGGGSVLTWLLYGFNFGSGISAPFAIWLNSALIPSKFWAQFCADMGIDVADKIITVLLVFLALRFIPSALKARLPMGGVYIPNIGPSQSRLESRKYYRRFSLRSEIVVIVIIASAVLGTLSTVISYAIYRDTATQRYIGIASGVADLMRRSIDGDKIAWYMENPQSEEYAEVENALKVIRQSFGDVEYMYVYDIRSDGCHVVFDLDTSSVAGAGAGEIVPLEDAFTKYMPALLSGGEIEPVISNGMYGWLLTVYKPLFDNDGKCSAYVGTDIEMDSVMTDRLIYIIKICSLLFGAAIILAALVLLLVDRRLIAPINAMTEAASEFAYESESGRAKGSSYMKFLKIKTGDELENLYHALEKTVSDVADYIDDINLKSNVISRMQHNIIISFADMVENRDQNTGEHIKRTASYVSALTYELKREGCYSNILTDEFIDSTIQSAPLHDIGKIRISDTILNKPCKLSDEEFAIMKTHTTAGHDILSEVTKNVSGSHYLDNALDMAMYHHERWDGSGYPSHLCGDAIPLSARIMAVADVFDALISKRSYKEPMSFEDAVKIIEDGAGSAFDPLVVKAFLNIKDEIRIAVQ